MAAFVLGLQEIKGLFPGESAATLRVVLQHEINKGLADDHAHLGWLAGFGTGMAASTFIYGHIRRSFKEKVTSHGIRNNLLQVLQGNFLVQRNN